MPTSYTWYSDRSALNNPDSIHQTLALGNLQDIKNLLKKVGVNKVKAIFINHPKKIYTKSGFNFISKFILQITSPIKESEYLKSTLRHTR